MITLPFNYTPADNAAIAQYGEVSGAPNAQAVGHPYKDVPSEKSAPIENEVEPIEEK